MSNHMIIGTHRKDENSVKTLYKKELSTAILTLKILEKHAIIIYDIALWIWKTKSLLIDLPSFIDFFMQNPNEYYQLYKTDYNQFMLL